MSALSVFSFSEKLPVRVSTVDNEPWFVAKDIAQCLEYSQSSINQIVNVISSVPDQWKGFQEFETRGGKQKLLSLSEQGLYFFLGRSDKPKALPFQMWLAGEVLPAIRKTGQYSVTEKSTDARTITPEQQYLLKEAVKHKAKTHAAHYQTIYRAIYARYKIARYDQLPQDKFRECLQFITEINPNIPINPDRAIVRPERCPVCGLIPVPEGSKVFTRDDQKKIAEAIRPLLQDAMDSMRKIEEERSHAWTCFHEISLYLCKIC